MRQWTLEKAAAELDVCLQLEDWVDEYLNYSKLWRAKISPYYDALNNPPPYRVSIMWRNVYWTNSVEILRVTITPIAGGCRLLLEAKYGTFLELVVRLLDELPDIIATPQQLTPRENEVAGLLAEGCNYRQIADEFTISVRTAQKHGEHIARKWGVDNDLALLQEEARRRSLIT